MADPKPSHPQHKRPLWRTLLDAPADRQRRWRAHADLLAEQVAEQGGAAVQAGLRLWAESLRVGWGLGRQWQGLTLDAWRRSVDLLR